MKSMKKLTVLVAIALLAVFASSCSMTIFMDKLTADDVKIDWVQGVWEGTEVVYKDGIIDHTEDDYTMDLTSTLAAEAGVVVFKAYITAGGEIYANGSRTHVIIKSTDAKDSSITYEYNLIKQ